jgi:DNA-binding IclR family transcriptional regulator
MTVDGGTRTRGRRNHDVRQPAATAMTAPTRRDGSVKAVERSIDLLLLLAHAPMTLTEVCQRSQMSKSTVLRLLITLGHGGLVVRDPVTKDYRLGPGCLRLGHGFVSGRGGFEVLARDALREVWASTGETVAVHIRLGTQRVCVDELPSAEALRLVSGIGMAAPLHVGSAGRVLLAFLPPADVDAIMEGVPLDVNAWTPVTSLAALHAELAAIRDRGYALSEGERVRGASAVSVPVHGTDGVIAALSALGPGERFTRERRIGAVPDLLAAAGAIGRSLASLDPSG